MTAAYYNEIEPYCAQWLRDLINAGRIAPGDVDERDIRDVRPIDLRSYTQCHFFAGIGGWSHALRLAGWPDHRKVWTGSCPCQPFSAAGKRRGFDDERHLWPFWQYLIDVERPPTVFGEQVAKATDWLGLVRSDLEALGYAMGAIPVEAASAGADQLRDRFWFVAHSAQQSERKPQYQNGAESRSDARPDAGGTMRVHVGSSSERLAFGSIAEDQRGNVRHERTAVGEASDRGEDVGCANGHGRTTRRFASARARFGRPVKPTSSVVSERQRERVRGERPATSFGAAFGVQRADEQWERVRPDTGTVRLPEYEWVLGADGKARRVKPGVRLLAHDVPARVAKLRAFGNAIVPACAAEFIKAATS